MARPTATKTQRDPQPDPEPDPRKAPEMRNQPGVARLSNPPGGMSLRQFFQWLSGAAVAMIPLYFIIAIVATLVYASGFQNFGWSFFSTNWNPNPNDPSVAAYGWFDFAVGSAITSAIALALAMVLSLGLAVCIVSFLPPFLSRLAAPVTDMLAGIPSVVYGIWGYVILAPYFSKVIDPWMVGTLGFLPGFNATPTQYAGGVGLILAIFILTIMVVPITTALVRDSLRSIPKELEEAGLALGATRWETMRRVKIPFIQRSIFSAGLLGFGRAIGETVAVFMVIGNEVTLPTSIFGGSTTMATLLVSQMDSAFTYPLLLKALVEIALVLMVISLSVNAIGLRLLGRKTVTGPGGIE